MEETIVPARWESMSQRVRNVHAARAGLLVLQFREGPAELHMQEGQRHVQHMAYKGGQSSLFHSRWVGNVVPPVLDLAPGSLELQKH